MTDSERLKLLKTRAPGAVEALVEEYTPHMLASAMAWGLPRADAEEAVQDAYLDFLAALDRFEGRSALKTFLFGVLFNKCSERRRKSRREEATEDIEAAFEGRFGYLGVWNSLPRGPEEEAVNDELKEWLAQCARGLSPDQRAAFQLKVVEGIATEDACKMLGVSATNFGVLLFRGRNKLRECLEKKWMKR
ncbi:MAG: sigma-70 family RNA polymerase sigma factor [Elusimicrobiota bacterium]|nr:MAG: sigma-70 family RNA polymerase sigma factor [Elusimicrobiota bacterium]